MSDHQLTFPRNGRFYHADKDVVELLRSVREWERVAADAFEQGLKNGRIVERSATSYGQTVDHATDATSQRLARARRDGYSQGIE
jgi:hypothetical protein